MATILMTWELGGGMGHLMQLLPLARGLVERGHTVYGAFRELPRVEAVFGPGPVKYLQAPHRGGPGKRSVRPPITYTHLLHNCTFGELPALRTATTAWRNMIRLVRPDLIVFDHSPTALLASRAFGTDVRRVVIGSGFCIPPDLPDVPLLLRPWRNNDPERLLADERATLDALNGLLREWRRSPLDRVMQLYSDVDDQFLVTFAELDHFDNRDRCLYRSRSPRGVAAGPCTVYRGAWTEGRGRPPVWPEVPTGGGRKRIFAYLKNFPALTGILDALRRSGHPTVVYADGMPAEFRWFASETLQFTTSPVHLGQAARECDLAVLNSGHGATASFLLAGKPALLLPIYLEQGMLAQAAVRNTNAVVDAPHKDGAKAAELLEGMLATEQYSEAARRFASRYAAFDPAAANERMLDRMEQLMGGGAAGGVQGNVPGRLTNVTPLIGLPGAAVEWPTPSRLP